MCLQSKFFENTEGKGEIARKEQFLLFLQCFLPICRAFYHLHKIQNCRLQTLTVWEGLKFVVWKGITLSQTIMSFNYPDKTTCVCET